MDLHESRYEIVIQWSEDDHTFIAAIPALPGCMADGATRVEALEKLDAAAELSMAKARKIGREVPVPES